MADTVEGLVKRLRDEGDDQQFPTDAATDQSLRAAHLLHEAADAIEAVSKREVVGWRFRNANGTWHVTNSWAAIKALPPGFPFEPLYAGERRSMKEPIHPFDDEEDAFWYDRWPVVKRPLKTLWVVRLLRRLNRLKGNRHDAAKVEARDHPRS